MLGDFGRITSENEIAGEMWEDLAKSNPGSPAASIGNVTVSDHFCFL